MAQSGKVLKLLEEHKEDDFDFNNNDIAPYEFVPLPTDLAKLAAEYAWETPLQRPSLFVGVDYLLNNILFLAEHAGPLEQFKRDVTKFLGRELTKKEGEGRASVLLDQVMTMDNREGTFVQCLAIGLDRTIRKEYEVCLLEEGEDIQEGKVYVQVQAKSNKKLRYIVKTASKEVVENTITAAELEEKNIPKRFDDATLQQWKPKILAITTAKGHILKDGFEIDKGMTEEFIEIVESFCEKGLLPLTKLQEVKNQISQVALPEDKEAKEARTTAAKQLFDGFAGDVERTEQAIKTFKGFVEKMKLDSMNERGHLKDDRYSIGLIHLMGECIAVLAQRSNELNGGWYGQKGDRFCYKIIGGFLQHEHEPPSRVRQIFKMKFGLYSLFENHETPDRAASCTPAAAAGYRGVGSRFVLGDNSYYNDFGGHDDLPRRGF
ncbi:MAG: hypothetical protein ABI597_12890, partial [Gammaproteobacteria bacterium]